MNVGSIPAPDVCVSVLVLNTVLLREHLFSCLHALVGGGNHISFLPLTCHFFISHQRGGAVSRVQVLGGKGARACIILVLRKCIWNAPAVSFVLPPFHDTGSGGLSIWLHPGWLAPFPCGE